LPVRFDPSRTVLAGQPAATLQAWLTSAQQAYAALMIGQSEITVGYDGKTVTYVQADVARLEGFITLLQRQLGVNAGRRALRPWFR
jgi:hypothetical protein